MDLTQILEGASKVGNYIITICAALTAFGALIKPIRVWALKKINKSSEERDKKLDDMRSEIKHDISDIKADVKETNKRMDEMRNCLEQKIQNVSDENIANERDRIKHEILGYEGMARQGRVFSEREFEGIREDYYKYHDKLHGNGKVTEAYNYIVEYYNANAASWK